MGTDDARTVVNSILGAYGLPQLKATKGFKYFDDFEVRFLGWQQLRGPYPGPMPWAQLATLVATPGRTCRDNYGRCAHSRCHPFSSSLAAAHATTNIFTLLFFGPCRQTTCLSTRAAGSPGQTGTGRGSTLATSMWALERGVGWGGLGLHESLRMIDALRVRYHFCGCYSSRGLGKTRLPAPAAAQPLTSSFALSPLNCHVLQHGRMNH